jgi:hypothetical protein
MGGTGARIAGAGRSPGCFLEVVRIPGRGRPKPGVGAGQGRGRCRAKPRSPSRAAAGSGSVLAEADGPGLEVPTVPSPGQRWGRGQNGIRRPEPPEEPTAEPLRSLLRTHRGGPADPLRRPLRGGHCAPPAEPPGPPRGEPPAGPPVAPCGPPCAEAHCGPPCRAPRASTCPIQPWTRFAGAEARLLPTLSPSPLSARPNPSPAPLEGPLRPASSSHSSQWLLHPVQKAARPPRIFHK